jgi:hypothetical protein
MNHSKVLIVSNHANHDLEWIKMSYDYGFSPKNTIIYDRTPEDFPNKSSINHLGKVIKTSNVGSNPHDIGKYIVNNYENLPEQMIFVKGNLLEKGYSTKERFIYALKSNWFVPIDRGPLREKINEFPLLCNDNWFSFPIEWEFNHQTCGDIANLHETKVYPRIKNFKDFLKDLFVIEENEFPTYISFAPGANYAVPKNCILKYNKNLYKKIMFYTNYHNNPLEAHWFERVFQYMWQGCLTENFSYIIN